MASLASVLPAPTRAVAPPTVAAPAHGADGSSAAGPPPYGKRKGFVPRSLADFGDGGAFPEIHVAQYPKGMGKKKQTGNTLALQVDADGKIAYDAIAKQGRGKDVVVHSKFTDVLPKDVVEDDASLQRPGEEEIAAQTEATRQQLERIVAGKQAAQKTVRGAEARAPAQYVRYTPAQQGSQYASGAGQRIIRMMEAPVDPMEPPKFKHKKIPGGPPSPPAPVLHSPPRKLTPQEQRDWVIPPCVSNWKNAKGYTIPLEKRLASDGRGLQETQINHSFAKFAEALYTAEMKAREGVELRAQVQKKLAQREKEKHENNLRLLAQKAREERAGIRAEASESSEDEQEVAERDRIRDDRHYERERERRLARARPEKRAGSNLEDRDISEKVALGLPIKQNLAGENLYDQRLFNQSKGLGSGFDGGDDAYNIYDKPMFANTSASSIYRPRGGDNEMYGDEELEKLRKSRFTADKGFQGADASAARDGPVQFEKEEDDDVFGLDKFFTEAKKGKQAMDSVGKGSTLAAGASSSAAHLRDGGGTKRDRLDFEAGKGDRDTKRGRY